MSSGSSLATKCGVRITSSLRTDFLPFNCFHTRLILSTTNRECLGPVSPVMAPTNQPTFTFIDHDDDLSSKRINDANARRAIRSHVMRDVRRRERIAGLRRVSRRDGRTRKKEPPFIQSSGLHSSEHILPLRRTSAKPEPVGDMLVLHRQPQYRGGSNVASSASSSSPEPPSQSNLAPSLLDPFGSLPGAEVCTDMVNKLVFYCRYPCVRLTSGTF